MIVTYIAMERDPRQVIVAEPVHDPDFELFEAYRFYEVVIGS